MEPQACSADAETWRGLLRSDRGYVGVLAYNPVHSDYGDRLSAR